MPTATDHREIARELAGILDRVGSIIANGGPAEEHRDEVVALLARASSLTRAWASFGNTGGAT